MADDDDAKLAELPADADVELDDPPRLGGALRSELLAEIAPFALAVDLRRWRAVVAARAREERLLADLLRAGHVGTAPMARVSIGAELDLRLRELPPSPAGLDRGDVAARLATARQALAEDPEDAAAARRWVRLRFLAGALRRSPGPSTPALELLDAADGAVETGAGERAQIVVAVAVVLARAAPSPEAVATAIRRLGAAAPAGVAANLPPAEPAEWRARRAAIEAVRMRLLAPLLREVDWGGPYAEEIDWLAWTEGAAVRPPEVREALAPRVRRRLLAAALLLPPVAAAAALALLPAPDAGRLPAARLTQAQLSASGNHVVAAGIEVADDWSSVTVQLAAPAQADVLELQLRGVSGEVVAAAGADGRWAVAGVPAGTAPADVEAHTDGTTLVVTLPRTLHPAGLRVVHFGSQGISPGGQGGRPTPGQVNGDALPSAPSAVIAPVGPPPAAPDWADLAVALVALAGAAVGIRLGLIGAAGVLGGLVASLSVGGALAIPVARGLARLTGDQRSAAAVSAVLMAAIVAAGLAAAGGVLARREPYGLLLARLRVSAASLPRVVTLPAAALAGIAGATVAAAMIALLCVDLGPLSIAATRVRTSITGTRAVDVARWVFGA